jgi:hypothetical protein
MEATCGISTEYLKGVAKDRVIILDADKVPGNERIVVHADGEHDV